MQRNATECSAPLLMAIKTSISAIGPRVVECHTIIMALGYNSALNVCVLKRSLCNCSRNIANYSMVLYNGQQSHMEHTLKGICAEVLMHLYVCNIPLACTMNSLPREYT